MDFINTVVTRASEVQHFRVRNIQLIDEAEVVVLTIEATGHRLFYKLEVMLVNMVKFMKNGS